MRGEWDEHFDGNEDLGTGCIVGERESIRETSASEKRRRTGRQQEIKIRRADQRGELTRRERLAGEGRWLS